MKMIKKKTESEKAIRYRLNEDLKYRQARLLKKYREKAKIQSKDLAAFLDCSLAYIYQIESGNRGLKDNQLLLILIFIYSVDKRRPRADDKTFTKKNLETSIKGKFNKRSTLEHFDQKQLVIDYHKEKDEILSKFKIHLSVYRKRQFRKKEDFLDYYRDFTRLNRFRVKIRS